MVTLLLGLLIAFGLFVRLVTMRRGCGRRREDLMIQCDTLGPHSRCWVVTDELRINQDTKLPGLHFHPNR